MYVEKTSAEIKVIIFEPVLDEDKFFNSEGMQNLDQVKEISDVIITNRMTIDLNDVKNKVYTRDLFNSD